MNQNESSAYDKTLISRNLKEASWNVSFAICRFWGQYGKLRSLSQDEFSNINSSKAENISPCVG